jgi:transposase-like protein
MAKRRRFSEKVSILRRHLLDNLPVSDVCDEYGLNPNVFYRWQKAFFENAATAFERRSDARERKLERENEALRTKLAHQNEVIGEIMAEQLSLNKSLGDI